MVRHVMIGAILINMGFDTGLPHFVQAQAQQQPVFSLTVGDSTHQIMETIFDETILSRKGSGVFRSSAGRNFEGMWEGTSIPEILNRYIESAGSYSVTFVARDGYRMTFPDSTLRNNEDGEWILARYWNGDDLFESDGGLRTVKINAPEDTISAHLSVRGIREMIIEDIQYRDFLLEIAGMRDVTLDRQTVQSCVSCHRSTQLATAEDDTVLYEGIQLSRLLAFSDDSLYAPHGQHRSIVAYQQDRAREGYDVCLTSGDGKSVTLSSQLIDENHDIVLAMFRNGAILPYEEFPLRLIVGDGQEADSIDAKKFPNVTRIDLSFE